MNRKEALNSIYVIDGVQQEFTPAALLDALGSQVSDNAYEPELQPIIDESPDPVLISLDAQEHQSLLMLPALNLYEDSFPLAYANEYSKLKVAEALIETLWRKGHYKIGNLALSLEWNWSSNGIGSMAAFYNSVQSVADYVDALGLNVSAYSYKENNKLRELTCNARLQNDECDDADALIDEPYKLSCPKMLSRRAVPSELVYDTKSWLIYVPFDSADPRLGGSAYASMLGLGASAPQIGDADYFLDCYEVLREFVEDGVVISATTVSRGGLVMAAQRMCSEEVGIELNISNLQAASLSEQIVLFAEIPGVLIQIRDCDFDYVDAELLLQDVAYFPLGHPNASGLLSVANDSQTGLQAILSSLMNNAEGED